MPAQSMASKTMREQLPTFIHAPLITKTKGGWKLLSIAKLAARAQQYLEHSATYGHARGCTASGSLAAIS